MNCLFHWKESANVKFEPVVHFGDPNVYVKTSLHGDITVVSGSYAELFDMLVSKAGNDVVENIMLSSKL